MTKGRCVDGCSYFVDESKQCARTLSQVVNCGRYCGKYTNRKSLFSVFKKWWCKLFF